MLYGSWGGWGGSSFWHDRTDSLFIDVLMPVIFFCPPIRDSSAGGRGIPSRASQLNNWDIGACNWVKTKTQRLRGSWMISPATLNGRKPQENSRPPLPPPGSLALLLGCCVEKQHKNRCASKHNSWVKAHLGAQRRVCRCFSVLARKSSTSCTANKTNFSTDKTQHVCVAGQDRA